LFPPSDEFVAAANAGAEIYEEADADYLAFWNKQALSRLTWFKEPTVVLDDSNAPFFKWFRMVRSTSPTTASIVISRTSGDKVAYHWVGEPGDTQDITYRDLYERGHEVGQRPEEPRCREG
jgi:acetyl-CoA synthetase